MKLAAKSDNYQNEMSNPLGERLPAFKHAFSGLFYVFKTQKNAWIHAIATILVAILAIILRLPALHLAILIIIIGLVWAAEALNTSIEALIDLISPDQHPLAKIAKDTGAASVLILSIAAVLIGLLILGPPIISAIIRLITR